MKHGGPQSLDQMTWEERFWAAFEALLAMETKYECERGENAFLKDIVFKVGGPCITQDPAELVRARMEVRRARAMAMAKVAERACSQ